MKIALNIPEQLMTRLANQMQRNGQTAAEVIRQAMIEYFDRKDNWFDPANPLMMVPRSGPAQSEERKLEPGQTGGFSPAITWGGEKK